MADAQRGQFVIDCKSGEAAGTIYGLVHDKLSRIAVSLLGIPKREARRIIAKYQAQ